MKEKSFNEIWRVMMRVNFSFIISMCILAFFNAKAMFIPSVVAAITISMYHLNIFYKNIFLNMNIFLYLIKLISIIGLTALYLYLVDVDVFLFGFFLIFMQIAISLVVLVSRFILDEK